MFGKLVYLLLVTPGLKEAVLFVLTLIVLFLIKRRWQHCYLSVALIFSSLIAFLFGVIKDLPLYSVLAFLVALIGLISFKKAKTFLHSFIGFLISVALIVFSSYFISERVLVRAIEVNWEIGERGKAEDGYPEEELLVKLTYGYNTEGIYSDELANYLTSNKPEKVILELNIHYFWGSAFSTSVKSINGRKFSSSNGYSGCTEKCSHPYPEYYFGI